MSTAEATTPTDPHPQYLHNLLQIVHTNLQHQADWHSLSTHTSPSLPRPLISGIPPEGTKQEWVLPVSLREKWSLRKWAEVFDALPEMDGDEGGDEDDDGGKEKEKEGKKLMMGVVSDDSTVVYYVVGEGIIKPKQN
ncbi:tRNA-splicing endonuclease subunit Sen15 [Tuber borchii]|uniref:tRNA-splicing endonuclease subunit Sen15 n=1 Tax=Tuber borchii TaxID=42251 RepID=A0A2T6ZXA0_TUBBO|nr:tRNA-splicing endonuclease subunit Sen15 [Tuber borchii]